jgi:hypothetical protein
VALTAANEVMARKIALENMDQSAAYACAYKTEGKTPDAISKLASAIANRPEVADRINVLRERATAAAVKKAALTREDAMDEAGQLLKDAMDLGQISAGVAAAKLRAQLAGHLDEKKQDPKGALEDMDLERLLELRKAVEDKVARSREALAMTDAPAPVATPAPIRRVI